MRPDQIISLMKYKGHDNTLAMGDHDDHIHVGFKPVEGGVPDGDTSSGDDEDEQPRGDGHAARSADAAAGPRADLFRTSVSPLSLRR
jgi:hypothetical protein